MEIRSHRPLLFPDSSTAGIVSHDSIAVMSQPDRGDVTLHSWKECGVKIPTRFLSASWQSLMSPLMLVAAAVCHMLAQDGVSRAAKRVRH